MLRLTLRVLGGLLWVGLLLLVLSQLLAHLRDWVGGGRSSGSFVLGAVVGAEGAKAEQRLRGSQTGGAWPWLSAYFVCTSLIGHHLLCQFRVLTGSRRFSSRSTPLQSQLLETAALQLQGPAIPVAAHALGLVPARLAAAATSLPLCEHSLHAAGYCAIFLTANVLCFFHRVARPHLSVTCRSFNH